MGIGGLGHIALLVIEEVCVGGSLVRNYTELVELMELNADGKVKMHYTRYDLADINTALDDFKRRRFAGRASSSRDGRRRSIVRFALAKSPC